MRVRTHTNPFSYRQRFEKQNWHEVFENFRGLLDYEIGCGRGVFVMNYAQANPDRGIVAIDIRKTIVELLEEKVKESNVENVLPVWGNGQICLEDMFTDESLDRIFIFHPDPWAKDRHSNRRVLNNLLLDTAVKKLKPDGVMYISTDVQVLWEEMTEIIKTHGAFEQFDDPEFWDRFGRTRWDEISEENKREVFCGVFRKKGF